MEIRLPLLGPGVLSPARGVVVLALLTGLAGCGSDQQSGAQAQNAAPPAVSVATLSSQPFTSTVEFIGETQAFQKVDIRARVTGFLLETAFSEGSDVKDGDILFRIDKSEYEVALASANAALERAEATRLQAQQTLDRTRTLVEQDTVSEAQLDQAVAAEGTAAADVASAKAQIDRAELDLGYTEITSPMAGRIGKSQADAGNLIGPDSGVLATVVALDPIRVVFSVSERVFLDVQKENPPGQPPALVPKIRLANGELYDQEGAFQFADNQVDPSTGTIRVFVEFPNPDTLLLPGLFVTVVLSSEESEPRILIPQSALQLNQSGPFVLVVDGESRAQIRQIETGERRGSEIVVVNGLEDGETIIVDGIQKVRPGIEVATTAVSGSAAQN